MTGSELKAVASNVLRRAQRQGYVVPREVRAELEMAGLPNTRWREVLALAGSSLQFRQGRYYYLTPVSPRLQQEQNQQQIVARAVRQVIRRHKATSADQERRQQDRIDYIQPITVQTEDGREIRVLTRDLSPTGIRLLATRSFLGQKLRVYLPNGNGSPLGFLVRILWTCAIGDDLYENGGTFVELASPPPGPLKVVDK
jgi:hypothetical protein